MRKLKYAMLGLINRQPLTGYDITKEFNKELSYFWYAKHSQIYPELQKLVDEGLLEYETILQGEKLEKKLYSITEKGKSDFCNWLVKDVPLEPNPKDVIKLKSYFSENMSRDDLYNLLQSQKEKRVEKLHYLEEFFYKFKDIPDFGSEEFGNYMILEGALIREKAYIEWLNKYMSYLDKI